MLMLMRLVGVLDNICYIPKAFQPLDLDESLICTCTQNPYHNIIGENFQDKSLSLTDEDRLKRPRHAIVIALTSIMITVMLNTAVTSDILNLKPPS